MSLPQKQVPTQTTQQAQQGQSAQQQVQSQNAYAPQQIQGFPFNAFMQQQQQQQNPMQIQGFPGNNYTNNASSIAIPTNMAQNLNIFNAVQAQPAKKGFNLIQFASEQTTEEGKKEETKLKLAAVIVTICDGSTFDSLFTKVKQDAGAGSRVAVYSCSEQNIQDLILQLKKLNQSKLNKRSDDLHLLLKDLEEIEDPTCVAINYECCSQCSDSGFSDISHKQIIKQLEFFLSHKYLVMYSDFSLKALIHAWSEIGNRTKLGLNPLIRSGSWPFPRVTLNFNPFTLKTCVSSQLQSVGELCPDQDHCIVDCMPNTIKYSIDSKYMHKKLHLPYEIEILTIAQYNEHNDSVSIQVPDFACSKKHVDCEKKTNDLDKDIEAPELQMKTVFGDAGHIVLDYEQSGGELSGKVLLSMTHWCELVKLGDNVSDDVLFQVAAKNLGTGSSKYQEMQATYNSMGGKNASGAQKMQQQQWISQQANMMVQQQAPCNNLMNSNIGYFSKKGNY